MTESLTLHVRAFQLSCSSLKYEYFKLALAYFTLRTIHAKISYKPVT